MDSIISAFIDDFHERPLPHIMPREQSVSWLPRKANVIIGMRRAGKTWFCYQLMQTFIDQGVSKKHFLYFNFEDERLLPFVAANFRQILDVYYRKYPELKEESCYLFLDEVQRIDGWSQFVRRILDTEKLAVCITGSSSKLLSTEIATSLRGRSLTTEIFPLSFAEVLRWNTVELKPGRFGGKTRAILQHTVDRFYVTGGFPEVQCLDADVRREVLRNYVDVVILRDVIERHGIKNTVALRSLIRHIMHAPATRFSVNKFFHTLKSLGVTCTKNDLYSFLDHLADAFLIYPVPIHSRSEKVRQVNPKKMYVIDTGLLEAMSLKITQDQGAILENMVYMHLRRQGIAVEYYVTKSGAEVDFVCIDRVGRKRLLQVCWNVDEARTFSREFRALDEAMRELSIDQSTIVTWNTERTHSEHITIVPIWKWLL